MEGLSDSCEDVSPCDAAGVSFIDGRAESCEFRFVLLFFAVEDALGYGFDFKEFGHGVKLASHCGGRVGVNCRSRWIQGRE